MFFYTFDKIYLQLIKTVSKYRRRKLKHNNFSKARWVHINKSRVYVYNLTVSDTYNTNSIPYIKHKVPFYLR